MNTPERPFEPLTAIEQFVAINNLALVVGEQNSRFDAVAILGDDDHAELTFALRDAVTTGIEAEQRQTFANIIELADVAPYEELAVSSLQVDEALIAFQAELDEKRADVARRQASIAALAKRAIALSPTAQGHILKLAEQHSQAVKAESDVIATGPDSARREALMTARAEHDTAYEVAGQPWPVPRISIALDIADEIVSSGVVDCETDVPLALDAEDLIEGQAAEPEDTAVSEKVDWTVEFRRKVGEAISALEADGIMSADLIRASVASSKSSSAILATPTAIQRMRDVGLLQAQVTSHPGRTKLSARDLVLMSLLNGNRATLGRSAPKRQAAAVGIVAASITSYFEKRIARQSGR